MSEEIAIITNAFIYACICFTYLLVKRRIDCFALVIGIYCVSAVAGCIYFFGPLARFSHIGLAPFLLLILLVVMFASPLAFGAPRGLAIERNADQIVVLMAIGIGILAIVPFFELAYRVSANDSLIRSGDYLAYFHKEKNTTGGADVLPLSLPCKVAYFFIYRTADVAPFLLFWMLVRLPQRKILIIGLVMAVCSVNLMSIYEGSRSGLVYTGLYFVILTLVFWPSLDKLQKRRIRRISVVIAVTVAAMFAVITMIRFDAMFRERANVSAVDWLAWYVGEAQLNFNNYTWNISATSQGDYLFGQLKAWLGLNGRIGLERRFYWESVLGIPQQVFYTFPGNVVQDFGKFGAMLLAGACFAIGLLLRFWKRSQVGIGYLLTYCIWAKVNAAGFTFFPYSGERIEVLLVGFLCAVILQLGSQWGRAPQRGEFDRFRSIQRKIPSLGKHF